MSDTRAADAEDYHAWALATVLYGAYLRAGRDRLVRELRTEDPKWWTYVRLARTVGCSPELIAYIVRRGREDQAT